MKRKEREVYWREVLARQQQSGLSVKAYCQQEGLCAHTAYLWRGRFRPRGQSVKFAVVKVRPETRCGGSLERILPGGERLQIIGPVEMETLRAVVKVLRERP